MSKETAIKRIDEYTDGVINTLSAFSFTEIGADEATNIVKDVQDRARKIISEEITERGKK